MNLLKRRKFVNVDELAEILGISRRHVWFLRAQGQLPPPQRKWRKSGNHRFIIAVWRTDELRKWIAKGCPPVDGEAVVKKTKRPPVLRPDTLKKVSRGLLRSKKYLSANEMALFLGVSKRSLWRFKQAGRIPDPVKFGKSGQQKNMWNTAELRRWLAMGCPTKDTIEFAHKNPIRAKMLTYKHRRQRIANMKSRMLK